MTCQERLGQSGLVVREIVDSNHTRDVFTGRIKPSSRVGQRLVDFDERGK